MDNDITLEQVKEFIEANKSNADVAEYIVSVSVDKPMNAELVSAYLQTTEGKNLIQPMMDQRVTDAIKTHDEKQKPKIDALVKSQIAAEMLRLNPTETPEQREMRELRQKTKEMEDQWEADKRNSKIKELAFKEGIDPLFIEGTPFNSVEESQLWMQRFKEFHNKALEKELNERLASTSFKPGSGKDDDKKKIDLSKLTQADLIKMELEGKLDEAIAN
ncbi:MAG: hypothetical protein WC895_04115 [Candidatus Shapirobacteria bacterium]|jgi:hypothetical protein